MPSVLGLFGEVLEGTIVAPIVVGGVVVAAASSPGLRKRMREWGVQALAGAMAAGHVAARELKSAKDANGGLTGQIKHRLMQATAEVKEEWEDFVEEARQVQRTRTGAGPAPAPARPDRPTPRSRRAAGTPRGRRRPGRAT